ncbi:MULTISPECIES: hypothetical protein [unclassified Lysobacter]|uniref:hypothetical protein n=1 Tax=unclassified Lysobacter TaxID=2635362 RepID=UPI001C21106C|nr:hypothetical protein [Lysobacter sp. MMG2]MBU8977191.1 hypothetical protein [Lysobacter sp. MMG2]
MNASSFSFRPAAVVPLAAAALALAAALAAAPASAQETGPVTLEIDCARPALPSQQDITRLTGVANFSQAYAVRARLMGDAKRACQSADKVRLVLDVEADTRQVARR